MDREQVLEDLKQWLRDHGLTNAVRVQGVLDKIDELEEEYE